MSTTQVEAMVFRKGGKFLGSSGQRIEILDVSCAVHPIEGEWQTTIKFAYETTDGKSGVADKALMPFVDMMARINAVFDPTVSIGADVLDQALRNATTLAQVSTNLPGTNLKDPRLERMQLDFKRHAPGWGLSPDDLGKVITIPFARSTKIVTIVGAKPKNHKYPIIVSGTRGGRWKIKAETVRKALGR
jgi:hypothetical protein